jgi:hypothetical protein
MIEKKALMKIVGNETVTRYPREVELDQLFNFIIRELVQLVQCFSAMD